MILSFISPTIGFIHDVCMVDIQYLAPNTVFSVSGLYIFNIYGGGRAKNMYNI
jgi:hypothetical protein